jgi:hypothetical protein
MNWTVCKSTLGIAFIQRLTVSQLLHDSFVETRAKLETVGRRLA